MFAYFFVNCRKQKAGSVKQIIIFTTLEERDCIFKRESEKPKSFMSKMIEVQQVLKDDITVQTTIVVQKNAEIVALKARSNTQIDKGDNSSGELKA